LTKPIALIFTCQQSRTQKFSLTELLQDNPMTIPTTAAASDVKDDDLPLCFSFSSILEAHNLTIPNNFLQQ